MAKNDQIILCSFLFYLSIFNIIEGHIRPAKCLFETPGLVPQWRQQALKAKSGISLNVTKWNFYFLFFVNAVWPGNLTRSGQGLKLLWGDGQNNFMDQILINFIHNILKHMWTLVVQIRLDKIKGNSLSSSYNNF